MKDSLLLLIKKQAVPMKAEKASVHTVYSYLPGGQPGRLPGLPPGLENLKKF